MRGVGTRATVLLIATLLCFVTGCTEAQVRAIDRAFATPPVDLRAVPGGVEVGLVCGPGVPWYFDLYQTDHAAQHISHTDYKSAEFTRTVVVPVPLAARHASLHGFLSLNPLAPGSTPHHPILRIYRGVPLGIYVFDFRYSDLPRTTTKRIAGGDCNR
jgi:hypothetical protein